MSNKTPITLDDAYALESPADNVRLYADWADTYDSDFIESHNYVCHLRVAETFRKHAADLKGAVLDVGCGTGVVGLALAEAGFEVIDGFDISPQMLAQSAEKKTAAGTSAYRNLIEGDLTARVDIVDSTYAGIVSAGTFTHGHLGPESLGEIWRIAASGAVCAIGINSRYFDLMGFGERLAQDSAQGVISGPEFVEVDMYSVKTDRIPHSHDTALIAVCRVN